MTSRPFGRLGLRTEGKTPVYVFDTSDLPPFWGAPFTDLDLNGLPYIGLPCRSDEPAADVALSRAAVEAVHEGAHAFNSQLRCPNDGFYGFPWAWFDEGTANLMESVVFPKNTEYLRYAMNWCDRPEVPLDSASAGYEAGMFLRYLAKNRLYTIADAWNHSTKEETALEALIRLMKESGEVFVSDDAECTLPFFARYCADCYFLWDPSSDGYFPEVYRRYGERAITESIELETAETIKVSGRLDHLACRYYRLYPKRKRTFVKVRLLTSAKLGRTPLKGHVTAVANGSRGMGRPLASKTKTIADGRIDFEAELTAEDTRQVDYIVLCVTNCGTRSSSLHVNTEHDDGVEYQIEADLK
jgi:hypothetical protein